MSFNIVDKPRPQRGGMKHNAAVADIDPGPHKAMYWLQSNPECAAVLA